MKHFLFLWWLFTFVGYIGLFIGGVTGKLTIWVTGALLMLWSALVCPYGRQTD